MNDTDDKSIQNSNDWLNTHGQPSYEILASLAATNTPEARESLQQIADKYDIVYTIDTSPKELLDKISLALKESD